MKRRFAVRRPSPAMAVSLAALFLALGGTSYAAFSLPARSVGTKQLKKGAVTTAKIKNGAVTDAKIAPGTITGDRINLSTLGTVPSANQANSANTANSATSAGNASHASNADNATHAGTADVANSPGTLPSGKSESGDYGGANGNASAGGYVVAPITFPIPLATALDGAHTIYVTAPPVPHCSGLGHADPGYLCAYEAESSGMPLYTTPFLAPGTGDTAGADTHGTTIYFSPSGAGSYVDGQWTVTAP